MKELQLIYNIYKQFGIFRAGWSVLRIFILPYKKLDEIIPASCTIVDIGCGNGGFTNYLALSSTKRKIIGIDLSKERIILALKSVGKRKNIKFVFGNVINAKLPKVDCYIMVDVLHHISFKNQEKLLRFLAKQLKKNSIVIIKEIDSSNIVPFLFGQTIEKILYPKERIYARKKREWIRLFKTLGLSWSIEYGTFYFPDSTCIYVLSKK